EDPSGGDGVAASDDVLEVLLEVGEARAHVGDLGLESRQRRLVVGRRVVVEEAGIAELVDRRLVAGSESQLEAGDDLDVVGHRVSFPGFEVPWFRRGAAGRPARPGAGSDAGTS